MFEKRLLIYRYKYYKTIRKLFLVFQLWKVTVVLTTLCILTSLTMNIMDLTGLYSVWSYNIEKKKMVKRTILVFHNSKFCIFSIKIKLIYFIWTKPYNFDQTLLCVISMWHLQLKSLHLSVHFLVSYSFLFI